MSYSPWRDIAALMSYIKEFQAALSRTRQWDIGDISQPEAPFPIDISILNALEETGHIPFPLRAAQVLSVNFGMYHVLSKKFHIPNGIITMGNVSVDGRNLMPATIDDFRNMLKRRNGEDTLGSYHIWTTLPGGVILDHVILSTLHGEGLIKVDQAIPAERYLYAPGDALPHHLTYHPMVAGLEFFVASGTIDPEAMEYLMGTRFPKQYD
ncbi:hypothetical protein [Pseudodesulfovibrio sp.]|uniref:hypothetical protein n=1 Tax=unclassified Pseudodesulfovibrio TaxID=2661612 RepID=UPI003B002F64